MSRTACLVSILSGVLWVGCAPADVAGNYTVSVTNGMNRCGIDGWDEGSSSSSIPVVVTQDGDQVSLVVDGVTGTLLDLSVGGSTFDGQVSGNTITAALIGDNARSQGECTYTTTVDLDATVDGDVIEGELLWRPVTNGHRDCGTLDTCEGNIQRFNGTRPPPAEG
jgi:hypothetical protein